jgi:hypothetical protein
MASQHCNTCNPGAEVCHQWSKTLPRLTLAEGTYYKCADEDRKLPKPFQTKTPCKLRWFGGGGENEYTEQAALTLVFRLLRQGIPFLMLNSQHRKKEPWAKLANKLVYKANPLAYVPPRRADDMNRFHDLMRDWFGIKWVPR